MRFFSFLSIVVVVCPQAAGAADLSQTGAFVAKYCADCHNAKTKEAGLDLTSRTSSPLDQPTFDAWVKAHDKVRDGEMPPPDADQPTADGRRGFTDALHSTLRDANFRKQQTDGRVILRRLNRVE